MYFEWKDIYSVNVSEIDSQHKKMFEIGGRLSNLVLSKDETDHGSQIAEILKELQEYTLYHFKDEERLMRKYGYEELGSHELEHIFLVRKLQRIQGRNNETNEKRTTAYLIGFVSDWIAGHILNTDMRYKEYFNQKGLI